MRFCERCGIDVSYVGMCGDCAQAEGEAAPVVTWESPHAGSGYRVNSSRRGPIPVSERARVEEIVARLTTAGWSANEIAREAGVASRTVHRYRVRMGVTTGYMNPFDHIRDKDAARRRGAEFLRTYKRNRRTS